MRAAFIVGIFGLAAVVAGTVEWASRRTSGTISPQEAIAQPDQADARPAAFHESPGVREDVPAPALADVAARELVLGDTGGTFRLNAVTLSDEMVAKIDEFFTGPDGADLMCGRFVVEGHT